MTNKAEGDRRTIRDSGSPLGKHSLNSKIMRDQRAGAVRVFGRQIERSAAVGRRESLKRQRKQALYDGIGRIFQGSPTEEDILNFVLLADEFEEADSEVPNAATIDFQGMQPSNARYGEPGFFRKKRINL